MDIALIFDALISVLLVATISYAIVLNRKLGTLRDAKSEMEALIGQFSQSADRAGAGVQSLKEEARRSGEALQGRVEAARGLVDDLGFLIERGSGLAERLDGGVGAARAKAASGASVGHTPAPAARTAHPAAKQTETKPAPGDAALKPKDATDGGAPEGGESDGGAPEGGATDLSAAESELLKALQGMR